MSCNSAPSATGGQKPINTMLYCFSAVVFQFIRHYFPTSSKSGISWIPIGMRPEKWENSAKSGTVGKSDISFSIKPNHINNQAQNEIQTYSIQNQNEPFLIQN